MEDACQLRVEESEGPVGRWQSEDYQDGQEHWKGRLLESPCGELFLSPVHHIVSVTKPCLNSVIKHREKRM